MAKIIKITGYLVTPDDYIDEREVALAAGEILGSKFDCIEKPFVTKIADVDNWHDNHELNRYDCPIAVCEQYFKRGVNDSDKV